MFWAQTLCEVVQGRGGSIHRAAGVSGSDGSTDAEEGVARRRNSDKRMLCTHAVEVEPRVADVVALELVRLDGGQARGV